MKFTHAESRLLTRLAADGVNDLHDASDGQKLALLCVAEACPCHGTLTRQDAERQIRKALPAVYRKKVREKYGFVLSLIVLAFALIAFEAALSWAVERFLNWLFPEKAERVFGSRLMRLEDFQEARRSE